MTQMGNANFDAQAFLQQTVEAPMQDEADLVPPDEYEAVIDKVGATKPKDNDSGVNVQIMWEITSDELRTRMNRPKIIVPQFMFCPLDENGRISTSGDANWRLGQVRTAVGQNGNGPWHIGNLAGAGPARIRVTHNTYKGNTSAQVDRVVALT